MKVAYIINQYPKVSHSFIRREILALERRGFDIQRIALRGWNGPFVDQEDILERDRTRYVLHKATPVLLFAVLRVLLRVPVRFFVAVALARKMARDSDRPLPYHLVYVAEACRIVPWLRAFGALRVHAHFGTNSAEVAMLVHILGGPPYSFTAHGPDEFQRPMGLGEKVRLSSFVVAVSSFGRSQLYFRSRHSDWTKIKVVHCGLEKAFYDVPDEPLARGGRFVCVGRLCEAKGQLLLVEAAARLAAKGITFELVLAGDGPIRAELERLVAKYGLQRQVRITGWLTSSRVRDEILAARALVLPSFAEGLPVVIMEAMSLRRPVIATYVGGIPELVRSGETGWLVPAGCVESLTAGMEDCLSRSTEELRRMGAAAYRDVTARHSIETEAGKLAALFQAD